MGVVTLDYKRVRFRAGIRYMFFFLTTTPKPPPLTGTHINNGHYKHTIDFNHASCKIQNYAIRANQVTGVLRNTEDNFYLFCSTISSCLIFNEARVQGHSAIAIDASALNLVLASVYVLTSK